MFPGKNAGQIKEELISTKKNLTEKIDEFFELYVKHSKCTPYECECDSDDDTCCKNGRFNY